MCREIALCELRMLPDQHPEKFLWHAINLKLAACLLGKCVPTS